VFAFHESGARPNRREANRHREFEWNWDSVVKTLYSQPDGTSWCPIVNCQYEEAPDSAEARGVSYCLPHSACVMQATPRMDDVERRITQAVGLQDVAKSNLKCRNLVGIQKSHGIVLSNGDASLVSIDGDYRMCPRFDCRDRKQAATSPYVYK
jgi:hypothetical protein